MENMNKAIGYIIGLFVLFLAGCDGETDNTGFSGRTSEVLFSRAEDVFVETRAPLIGSDGKGAKFGTFYVLQTTVDKPEQCFWGHYTHKQDEACVLTVADAASDKYKLFWADFNTKYHFRAKSVPAGDDGKPLKGVAISHEDNSVSSKGVVTYGDYTTGLEIFVRATIDSRNLSGGQSVPLIFQRQVC